MNILKVCVLQLMQHLLQLWPMVCARFVHAPFAWEAQGGTNFGRLLNRARGVLNSGGYYILGGGGGRYNPDSAMGLSCGTS